MKGMFVPCKSVGICIVREVRPILDSNEEEELQLAMPSCPKNIETS